MKAIPNASKPVTLNANLLHPYAAFQLYEFATTTTLNLKALANNIAKELETTGSSSSQITVVAKATLPARISPNGQAIHFTKTSQAAWTDDKAIQDIEQHVLVLISDGQVLGISTSASEVRKRIDEYLRRQSGLTAMPADVLENTLLRSAPLRTLWLAGIHRRSPFKADSKVLTGSQLQTALSPLDDRTFKASSGRADTGLPVASGVTRVGVSPKRSYTWIGPTNSLVSFISRFKALVGHIASRRTTSYSPLPVLAQALATAPAAGAVVGAFDFSFIAAETALDLDDALKLLLDEFEAQIEIATMGTSANQNFVLTIDDNNYQNPNRPDRAWKIDVSVTLADGSATSLLAADSPGWPRWDAFIQLLRNKSLWSVWYESGHSLGDGEWNMLDARSSNYEGTLIPVNFTSGGWNIKTEKPLAPGGKAVVWTQIGADASLFSWWIRAGMGQCFPNFNSATDPNSYAFCICDDGTNELADFIVLAKHQCFVTPTNPSPLAFIMVHLKASSSDKPGRSIAPKQYEEVLGQATKNLGRVHFPDTSEYLEGRLNRGAAMLWEWIAGQFRVVLPRTSLLPKGAPVRAKLNEFNGQRFHCHVIVAQPHQSAMGFTTLMNAPTVDFKTHMLCTLLCATDGAARASSANLRIVMSP